MSGARPAAPATSSPFRGIYVGSGLTTVGDVTGNTIGSQRATGSITFTSSSTSGQPTSSASSTSARATGRRTTTPSAASRLPTRAPAPRSSMASAPTPARPSTFTCQNNTIGGTVANSIQSTTTATGTTVAGHPEQQLRSATITGNTIRNLTAAGGTGTTTSASVIGITVTTSTANQTISQNTIYNLSNTNATAATVVTGIQFTGSTANVVARNLIYGLTAATNSATAEVNGIRVAGGTTIYRNNMITLGAGIANAIGAAASKLGRRDQRHQRIPGHRISSSTTACTSAARPTAGSGRVLSPSTGPRRSTPAVSGTTSSSTPAATAARPARTTPSRSTARPPTRPG